MPFANLSGVGDLTFTAFGNLSRNLNRGIRLVNGNNLEDILNTTTVEGVVPTDAVMWVYYADPLRTGLPAFRCAEAVIWIGSSVRRRNILTLTLLNIQVMYDCKTGLL